MNALDLHVAIPVGPSAADVGDGYAPSVLIVDDALLDQRMAGSIVAKRTGLRPAYARNGVEALEIIARESPLAVLTDLRMPVMDGLALVEAMRERFPKVPVVLMTAYGSEELALKALRLGAASYVPKRRLSKDLPGTLDQVLSAARVDRRHQRLLACEMETESGFVLENDPDLIPDLVDRLHEMAARLGLFDENVALRVDLAIHETLRNAIHHGNLEVSSDLRQDGEAPFFELIARRRRESFYADRPLHVRARFSRTAAVYIIRDGGPGFDPATLPDPTDPGNLRRIGGRGLMLIRTFMDLVAFNPAGNEITLTKYRTLRLGIH